MRVGIPKEIKIHEYRVGATPAMVRSLKECGHQVMVETNAGLKIGFTDEMYKAAGALIAADSRAVWANEMIIKVKEPQKQEYPLIQEGQLLFCYLHLAPDPMQTEALVKSGCVAIAYETVTDSQGRLPLLVPMSEIAGRIAIQVGSVGLQLNNGGKGLLLGGVPGVLPAKVTIIGGGAAGTESARMAMGLGAEVTLLDTDLNRLKYLDAVFGMKTLYSTTSAIDEIIESTDLLIGAVLIPGKTAPKLVTRKQIAKMAPGSVAIDIAIDQGGCLETSKPTSHAEPTYVDEGVIHYCVTNMPGACARTSTLALTNATSKYALTLANKGYKMAMLEDPHLRAGLNVCFGKVTNFSVAEDLGYPYTFPEEILC